VKWKTLKTETLEANAYLRFLADDFEADGRPGKYFYHANAFGEEAVNVFIQKEDGMFVMIREYRYLFARDSLTHAQGSIEQHETAEQAARREAREEAGYDVGELLDLGWFASAPAFSKERARVFLGTQAKQVGQKLDAMEQIEVVEMTAAHIDEAIANGTMWDGQAIACWYKVKAFLCHPERAHGAQRIP